MTYKYVTKPIKIGNIELKNRVVRPAHGTGHGRGLVNDELIAYHEARAKGGVALSILEVGSVHPTTAAVLNVFDPSIEPGYRKMVEVIKPYGMKLIQQLWHGGQNVPPFDGSAPWSASDLPGVMAGIVPTPMTKAMIGELIESFVVCAKRCEDCGLDGVEIHCTHGYLLAQFLSANTNKREDEYGGSFENRARLILEIVQAVRSAVSSDFVVGIRVGADLLPGGISIEEIQRLQQMLEARQLIDYVSISIANYSALDKIMGGMQEPAGYQMPTSIPISKATQLPTIVVGRYQTLDDADQCIREGNADMVGIVRGMIADPELVNKSLSGNAHRIRPCIACNQSCMGGALGDGYMRCTVNPAVGYESTLGAKNLGRVESAKKVLVIGGGPAGLEAARVAAIRGHKVTLIEAAPKLGGTLQIAARAPKRHGMMDIVIWQEAELEHLGVEIQRNTYVDFDEIMALTPDAVIIATGSLPRLDGIHVSHPGQPVRNIESPRVCSSNEIMASSGHNLGHSAIVVDDAGHYEGLAVSEYLVEKGLSVTYITRQNSIAPLIQNSLMVEPFLQRMMDKEFSYKIRARAVEVAEDSLKIAPSYVSSEEVVETLQADHVVFISANRPNRELYDQLKTAGMSVSVVGDANSPRYLETAIREGYIAGLSV